MKVVRDFFARSIEEQSYLRENTFCDGCNQADAGISSPAEFEESGDVYIEGRCIACGTLVVSQVLETQRTT